MSEDLQDLITNEEDVSVDENGVIEESVSSGDIIPTDGSIPLNSESLDKLLSIFDTVSKLCTDLSIVDGDICQHSDRKSSIVSADISSILPNGTFYFNSIGPKRELLEPFRKQQVEITLTSSEHNYIFKDEYSHLTFAKPLIKYMSNQYMTKEQLNEKLSIEDEQIFNYEMGKFLIERLIAMQKGLSATMVKVVFRGDKADFLVTTSDNTSTIVGKLITVDLEREVNGECVFPIQPFLLGNDDVFLTCFFRSDGSNLLLNINSNIREIPFSVWCISKIIYDENDEE